MATESVERSGTNVGGSTQQLTVLLNAELDGVIDKGSELEILATSVAV